MFSRKSLQSNSTFELKFEPNYQKLCLTVKVLKKRATMRKVSFNKRGARFDFSIAIS